MTTHDSKTDRRDIALSADLPGAQDVPALGPQTVMISGQFGALTNLISLPQGGQIWIAYEYQDRPAQWIRLWQQGGTTKPINLGWNNFVVNPGDCIEWMLASPTNTIKIAWEYA